MATPAVSVVVPVYNTERYVADTLESILKQTFQDFELIAIDDGSKTDPPKSFTSLREKTTASGSEPAKTAAWSARATNCSSYAAASTWRSTIRTTSRCRTGWKSRS